VLKYLVFWSLAAMLPLFAALLSLNRQWIGWAFYAMVLGLCKSAETNIVFFSNATYRGTSRGMEVSLLYLTALLIVLALAMRGRMQRPLPEGGIRLYALYFLLCLPGIRNADDGLVAWFEVWKMLMLFLVWHSVYGYLAATGAKDVAVKMLAFFTLANFVEVLLQHYGGVYQARGFFSHRNGMGMAMNLLGPMFFAGYLQLGLRDRLGLLCGAAFACAALSTMWSYSRGAIAVLPIGYGLAVLGSLAGTRSWNRVLPRLWPMVFVGLLGLVAIWPHLAARFTVTEDSRTKQASRDTRIALAHCAWEMMKEHPWAGVGINNWILNMDQDRHPYQERAGNAMGRELNYKGLVETVYLLVGAECGIPALVAMLAWFAWHWAACLRLLRRLRDSRWRFVPAGLLGGFSADYLQSTLEWVLRQKLGMFFLVFCFALIAHLRTEKPQREPEGMAA